MTVVVEGYVAGGADRVLAQLLPYFKNLQIELLVNTGLDTSVLFSKPLPDNVRLRKFSWITPADIGNWAASASSPTMVLIRRVLSVAVRYPVDILLFLRFLNYFRKNRPDILLINNGGYPGGEACRMAAVAAVVRGEIRIIHIIHNMAMPSRRLFFPMEWVIDRIVERGGDFVAVSDAVAKSLRQIRNLKINPVVIGNGLQIAPPPSPSLCGNSLEFLQVGYLGKVKNQKFSILALGILAQQGFKNVRITFAGKETESGYLRELTELAQQLGVTDQICFMGFVEEIEDFYRRCDAILLTSTVEGMPMCILEAMRAGRAVIATNVGGVPELIEHAQTGYLLKGQEPEELAEIWKRLLENPDIIGRMGARAHQRFVEKFTLDAQAGKYLELINQPYKNAIYRRDCCKQ